jgi:pimeloyl-ACP methyl ester carboxylesterase
MGPRFARALAVRCAVLVFTFAVMGLSAGTADAGISSPPILQMQCKGKGGATVVLVSGLGDPSALVWPAFTDRLPLGTHFCTYDRSGVGMSPPTSGPQTFDGMAAALHWTLRAHHVTGPLVLVGHSVGGDVAVTYAARYPAAVRSVVLLDATTPDFFAGAVKLIPAAATGAAASFRASALSLLDWQHNVEHLDGATAWPQLARIRSLARGIRMRVLAHGKAFATIPQRYRSALERLWQAGERRFAKLVPHTKVEIAPHSGHYIYLDAPNLVIRILLAEVKRATH